MTMGDTSVFLFLSRSCNLSCKHCYVSAGPDPSGHMRLSLFRGIVDYLAANGIDDVRLTGGEPTIHPDFDQMLDVLNGNNIFPRLITNGIRLTKMEYPKQILDKVDRCWISAYGLTPEQHRSIAGAGSLPLEEILNFVGNQTRAGYWTGLSLLLTRVDLKALERFLVAARRSGIRYLRFLFSEPTGRAASTNVAFRGDDDLRQNAGELLQYLRQLPRKAFEFLSINNPFDLDSASETGQKSCLLSGRRMWSISPEGKIYSCCFNIYDASHLVADALTIHGNELSGKDLDSYAARCKALHNSYWGTDYAGPVTCPISAISVF